MQRAIGISVHTGWGACVVVRGSLRKPEIFSNRVVELLDDAERFCFHRAVGMKPLLIQEWLTRIRAKALAEARSFGGLPGVERMTRPLSGWLYPSTNW
jgi:hypothetical protein